MPAQKSVHDPELSQLRWDEILFCCIFADFRQGPSEIIGGGAVTNYGIQV